LPLSEFHAGNHAEAMRRFEDAAAPEVHTGTTKGTDTVQFLWRWELAGQPHDPARWQTLDTFVHSWLPRAVSGGLTYMPRWPMQSLVRSPQWKHD
jgi:hypothetical protein